MNYNSISEILSSSNKTKLYSGEMTNTGYIKTEAPLWLECDGKKVDELFINANSTIEIEPGTLKLSVNARTTHYRVLTSSYKEEGTLYNYYKFFLITWNGRTTQYVSSHSMSYTVIYFDTGDIYLNMNRAPSYDAGGPYSLQTSSNTYNFSYNDRQVTFKKTDNGYNVEKTEISLEDPGSWRYLVKSDNRYFTIIENQLSEIFDIDVLTSTTFLNNGTEFIPPLSLLSELNNPEILYWSEKDVTKPKQGLKVIGTPDIPHLIYYDPIVIPDGQQIENMDVESSSFKTNFTISFDDGNTWKYYKNGIWVTSETFYDGMNNDVLVSIPKEKWLEIMTSQICNVRATLYDKYSNTSQALYYNLSDIVSE